MLLSVISAISTILIVFILSFLIGRYVQNKFRILISNTYISFSIGFSIYIAIITFLFMPIVFFAFPIYILISVFWIFNIFLIIFLFLSWRIINIKNSSIKQIIVFILLGIVLIIVTRFLTKIPDSGENNFLINWVKSNLYIEHLNQNIFVDKYHFGEGWYYFQTILLKSLDIDQTFMNFWILGGIVSLFISSVMFGFVHSMIRTNNITIYIASTGILIFIAWYFYNGVSSNVGTIPFIWNYILLITLFLNYLIRPRVFYLYIMAIISFAGWAFDSSQLFLYIVFIASTSAVLLLKKSHLLVEYLIILSFSLLVMLNVFLFNISYVGFSIMLIVSIAWFFVAWYTTNFKMKICREYSLIFAAKRWWIIAITLVTIFSITFIIFITHIQSYLNILENYSNSITNSLNRESGYMKKITWLFYLILIAGLFIGLIFFKKLKCEFFKSKLSVLYLSTAIVFILFMNPFLSILWTRNILPKNTYYLIKIPGILVPLISVPLLIEKIKFKSFVNVFVFATPIASIFSLFFTNSFMVDNLSLYNGYIKTTKQLGEYIKKDQRNKRITGDTDGLNAYVKNSLSFPVYSKSYDLLKYNKLDSQIYSQIDNSKVDLLIKLKSNVEKSFSNPNIYKGKYNFDGFFYIGRYQLFYR